MKNTHSLIVVALLCGASAIEAGQAVKRMALPVAGAAAAAYVGYQYGQRNAPARQDVIQRVYQGRGGAKTTLKFIIQEGKVGAGTIEVVGAEGRNVYNVSNCQWPAKVTVTHVACMLANGTAGTLISSQATVGNFQEVMVLEFVKTVKDALNYLLTELSTK